MPIQRESQPLVLPFVRESQQAKIFHDSTTTSTDSTTSTYFTLLRLKTPLLPAGLFIGKAFSLGGGLARHHNPLLNGLHADLGLGGELLGRHSNRQELSVA